MFSFASWSVGVDTRGDEHFAEADFSLVAVSSFGGDLKNEVIRQFCAVAIIMNEYCRGVQSAESCTSDIYSI